jgi:hypothetical protein
MIDIKLWIDDVRPAPEGYKWIKSVDEFKRLYIENRIAKSYYNTFGGHFEDIELIDIDHDAGVFANQGGDYIRILDFLENVNRSYPIRIHSMNPVGVENMRRIIQRNGWTEVR